MDERSVCLWHQRQRQAENEQGQESEYPSSTLTFHHHHLSVLTRPSHVHTKWTVAVASEPLLSFKRPCCLSCPWPVALYHSDHQTSHFSISLLLFHLPLFHGNIQQKIVGRFCGEPITEIKRCKQVYSAHLAGFCADPPLPWDTTDHMHFLTHYSSRTYWRK